MGQKTQTVSKNGEVYTFDNGFTMKREWETKTPNGNRMGGRWVLRDINGSLLEFDLYANDIACRYNLDLYNLVQ